MHGSRKRSSSASLSSNRRGVTMVEYALLIVAIVLVGVVSAKSLGTTIKVKSDQSGGDL